MKEPTIDPEQLAALIDGRLDERARRDLLARLAASGADVEILADATAAARDLEGAAEPVTATAGASPGAGTAAAPLEIVRTPVTPVTPVRGAATPRRRWRGPWLAMAAALAVVATLPWITRWREGRAADPGRYVDGLSAPAAGLPAGWERAPWTTTRGAGDPLTPDARAVRLGARFTDLRLAALARDSAATDAAAADVGALLAGVSGGGVAAGTFEEVRQRAGGPPALLDSLLTAAWPGVSQLAGAAPSSAGAWLEAARVAAARQDAQFFRNRGRAARDALNRIGSMPNASAEARAAAARARGAFPHRGAPDWDALGRALTELLGALGS